MEAAKYRGIVTDPASEDRLSAFCSRHYFHLLFGILVIGVALRIYLAMNSAYFWDEQHDWILAAVSISINPETPNLPLRTEWHSAFVSYLIWLGSLIGDGSHLAYRWTSILAGVLTIAVTASLARRFAGPIAGIAAAALVCLNEYHIFISILAVQLSWYMLFSALAILFFLCYLDRRAGWHLMLAAVFAGLSFLAYEIGGLTIIILAIYALIRLGTTLFFRREFYFAVAVGALIISPDIYANLLGNYSGTQPYVSSYSYEDLLGRISGIGLNPRYSAFLVPETVKILYPMILDRPFVDPLHDNLHYKAMNSFSGLVLCISVLFWILAILGWVRVQPPNNNMFYILLFCGVFGIFTLIETGVDSSPWHWVGVILIPGAVLAGGLIAQDRGVLRTGVMGFAGLGMVVSFVSLAYMNYGIPQIKGYTKPHELIGPPGMVDVEVHFDLCDLCDSGSEFRLTGVEYFRDATSESPPLSGVGTQIVQDAVFGTDDRRFRLMIEDPEGRTERLYVLRYELVGQGNPPDIVEISAYVPFDQSPVEPPIFWMLDP